MKCFLSPAVVVGLVSAGLAIKAESELVAEASLVAGASEATVRVSWVAESGLLYFAQFSETLEEGSWTYLAQAIQGPGLAELDFYPEQPEEPELRLVRILSTPDLGGDGMNQDNEAAVSGGPVGDGLTNQEEFDNLTDPLDRDTDDDGLEDGFEVDNDLDPLDDGTKEADNGALGDPDNDGWSNLQEQTAGTDPNDWDSDGDGIKDSEDLTPLQNNAEENPDGENLDIGTALLGRWDFEETDTTGALASTPQTTGGCEIAHSVASWDGAGSWTGGLTGMPSSCAHLLPGSGSENEPTAWAKLPATTFDEENTQSWSMWLQFPKDGLNNLSNTRTILSMGGYENAIDATGNPILHAYIDPGLSTSGNDDKLQIDTYWLPGDNYTRRTLASWDLPADLDDGRWHHIVIAFGSGNYYFYFDGASQGQRNSNSVSINLTPVGPGAAPWCYVGRFRSTLLPNLYESLGARIDRLRVYSDFLDTTPGNNEVEQLYHHDIDYDGLWDITEQRSLLWRDTNGDGIRTPDETNFRMEPYHWDEPTSDHDNDGLTSLDEQNVTLTNASHPDTDLDRLHDGWELTYNLDPLNAGDGGLLANSDSDTLTNLQEFMNGTDPTDEDTDGDDVNDDVEVAHGSDPNDVDDEVAPSTDEFLEFRLGIGDESESNSEDYHLVAYEYDPFTKIEREVFRLISGGHGQYDEVTSKIFRKWHSYTFRIEWQSSTLDVENGEGPDYDYTMKVEPVTSDPALSIIDAFDPYTGTAELGYQLLGTKNNVGNFEYISETKAVVADFFYIDLIVDTNLDGHLESLPDGVPPRASWLNDNSVKDRSLENATPSRPTVIDVNNNNTDSGVTVSPTSATVDNRNTLLDTTPDRIEHTDKDEGHAFGTLRIWANPVADYGTPWTNRVGTHKLRLSLPEAGHDQIVRVYGWESYPAEPKPGVPPPPTLLLGLGSGQTSHDILSSRFFSEGKFRSSVKANHFQDLFLEGLTYGTAKIRLEVVKLADNSVVRSDEVLVTVNVDRVEQNPTNAAGIKDARHLRGFQPHHVGLRKTGVGTGSIRAVRGEIVVRVPRAPIGTVWRSRHTPMLGRKLRQQIDNASQNTSGSSFWVGLKQTDSDGQFQWIQTGLRWVMEPDRSIGSYPAAYIESGDTHFLPIGVIAKSLHQASAGNGDQLGEGVSSTPALALSTWDSDPVRLRFVLFKPSEFDENGQETTVEQPWHVIFRDERPGVILSESNYIRLSVGKPVAQGSLNTNQADELSNRYRTQTLLDLDGLFETNQTIAFAPGTASERATIANIQVAPSLTATSDPSPNLDSGSKEAIYNWALATFNWQAVTLDPSDLTTQIKNGRSTADGDAEEGTSSHPDWNSAVEGGVLQVWDDRTPNFHETP